MSRKELMFTEGEYGFVHKFNIKKEDGTPQDISGYTGTRLIIVDELHNDTKLDITANLSIQTSRIDWTVQNGQTNYTGNFIGIIHLTGPSVLEKTFHFRVKVARKLL